MAVDWSTQAVERLSHFQARRLLRLAATFLRQPTRATTSSLARPLRWDYVCLGALKASGLRGLVRPLRWDCVEAVRARSGVIVAFIGCCPKPATLASPAGLAPFSSPQLPRYCGSSGMKPMFAQS